MEKNSLSPELKWEWVSGNLLPNLLHLQSDYTSEPQGSCTILLLYNSTDRKVFSDYYFCNK